MDWRASQLYFNFRPALAIGPLVLFLPLGRALQDRWLLLSRTSEHQLGHDHALAHRTAGHRLEDLGARFTDDFLPKVLRETENQAIRVQANKQIAVIERPL